MKGCNGINGVYDGLWGQRKRLPKHHQTNRGKVDNVPSGHPPMPPILSEKIADEQQAWISMYRCVVRAYLRKLPLLTSRLTAQLECRVCNSSVRMTSRADFLISMSGAVLPCYRSESSANIYRQILVVYRAIHEG